MNAPALTIDHVCVHFGGLTAIADMSFTVAERELVSLIGPNGAGKTTAFNVVTGFLRPTAGEVKYRGVSLTDLKSHEVANLGLVRTFQKTSVFAANSVFENVLIGLHRHGRSNVWGTLLALPRVRAEERRLREEAWEILDFVGLGRRAGELGGALPYGEQRLLEVAVALAADPSLLLLDEPVSGMNDVGNDELHRAPCPYSGPGHHRSAGRARHASRHECLRPHRRAQLRPHHRGRSARRDPAEP